MLILTICPSGETTQTPVRTLIDDIMIHMIAELCHMAVFFCAAITAMAIDLSSGTTSAKVGLDSAS